MMLKELRDLNGLDQKLGQDINLEEFPSFYNESEFPTCPDCNKEMTFYGQLDSINDNYCIARLRYDICFISALTDLETKSIIQSF